MYHKLHLIISLHFLEKNQKNKIELRFHFGQMGELAETTSLLRMRSRKVTEGSNPSLSATTSNPYQQIRAKSTKSKKSPLIGSLLYLFGCTKLNLSSLLNFSLFLILGEIFSYGKQTFQGIMGENAYFRGFERF